MLGFFPAPYPDELFYSMVARYQQRVSFMKTADILDDLFSNKLNVRCDLPYRLEYFCAKLPKGSLLTPELIISRHTLFPFYKPFLSEKRACLLNAKMKGNQESNRITSVVGTAKSIISRKRYLHYCPACINEDRIYFGEAYWHRTHQLPGIKICYKHSIPLMASQVQVICLGTATTCIGLEDIVFNGFEQKSDECVSEFDVYLAKYGHWLLEKSVPSLGLTELRNRYFSILFTKKLITNSGQVRQAKLRKSLVEFYGNKYLESLCCNVQQYAGNWMAIMFYNSHRQCHPLQHLLMMQFLNTTPEEIFCSDFSHYKPFGDPPFPCLNSAASHFRQSVIDKVIITHSQKTGRPIGKFYCSCGFVYSRIGHDESQTDRYKISRIISTEDAWDKKFVELTSDPTLSQREIGQRLGIGIWVVKDRLQRINDEKYGDKYCRHRNTLEISTSRYRKKILDVMALNPGVTRTGVRKLVGAACAWLNKNDNKWFYEHLPERVVSFRRRIVDWSKRDKKYYMRAQEAIAAILTEAKPVRITINRLERKMGYVKKVKNNFYRLPMTKKLISEYLETMEDFRIRRVRWWGEYFRKNNIIILTYKFKRKAGWKPGNSERIAAEIRNQLEQIEYEKLLSNTNIL